MALKVSNFEELKRHLNAQGVAELDRLLQQYAADLLSEAGRLEAVGNSVDGGPELTSSHLRDANFLLRRGYAQKPKSKSLVATQLASVVTSLLAGLLADMEKLRDPVILIIFILLLAAAIATSIISIVKG